MDEGWERRTAHSTNRLGVATGLLASAAFNEHPVPLRLSGVREMNPSLFEMLEQAEDLADAGEAFYKYMMAVFGLDPEVREPRRNPEAESDGRNKKGGKDPVRRFRSSFLRLLKGWGYDSNSPEGAVLKGWVESRFGLLPTFHKEPLMPGTGAWTVYMVEKMSSRFHNNMIYAQLDLMYEFCQWSLKHFAEPGKTHLKLYRGVNDFSEHTVVAKGKRRSWVIRLNNLVSFTHDREVADCFGDTVLEASVPVCKIAFFNTLLPAHPLKGEGEVLVVGGDYQVTAAYW